MFFYKIIIELEDIIADLKEYKTPLPDITTKLYQKNNIINMFFF